MRPGRRPALLLAAVVLGLLVTAPVAAFHDGTDHAGEVRIAVLDSGIDAAHGEFAAGQVVAWRDFVNGEASPYDDNGHGTATASVAAGGGVGESPGTALIIGKVCDDAGSCNLADVRDAIYWAVANDATIINLSLGSIVPIPGLLTGLDSAIAHARGQGVLVVVAAGNGLGNLGLVPYPSSTGQPSGSHQVLAVGSATESGSANIGTSSDPELTQAGVDVLAARPGGDYQRVSGTSFASPNAAGIAAEVQKAWLAEHGSYLSVDDLETFLKRTAIDTTAPPSLEGYGFLDKATSLAQVPDGMPQAPCTTPIQGLIPWSNYCHNALYVDTVADGIRAVW